MATRRKPEHGDEPRDESVEPRAGDVAATMEDPATLVPWKGNPRRNDGRPVDEVAASIELFGFGAPIVARLANREIIKGHTRWKAARKLGLALVPVRFLDISEEQAHRLALADNKTGELAQWSDDLDALLDELGDDLPGFDERPERKPSRVREVEVSERDDQFFLSVRGPLRNQAQALLEVRKLLEAIPEVEVEVGMVGRWSVGR